MTALSIRWLRDKRYPATVAHASLPVLRQRDAVRGERGEKFIKGSLSPLCMHDSSSVGDAGAEWEDAPYAKRCVGCVERITQLLESVATVPTAPVLVRFSVACLVDPDKVEHAGDLMRNYVARTKTFNAHKTPEVAMLAEPEA